MTLETFALRLDIAPGDAHGVRGIDQGVFIHVPTDQPETFCGIDLRGAEYVERVERITCVQCLLASAPEAPAEPAYAETPVLA